ncbi:alpha/beta fold hydrolase [Actinoplanes sp. KI2]|uniref:thioesterase II family protein n=1 Tax=Actinoplanes sp. KI2 TaxID=2983315 RepID=UPI0021D5A383|nr:thioesterase domain-containing protein [Actinoplanes sp. KI2]MCU7728823.1 alpha/beta fold hydrolase [Actinoplanes sp. KI2]
MSGFDKLIAESPFVRRARRSGRRFRLFCFPHAGAGAGYFAEWPALLPPEVELVAVQLPGREDRLTEPAFDRVDRTVRTVAVALRPYLQGSFAFFGHSGGALLAFELARLLRKRRLRPQHLFLSGQPAPGSPAPVDHIHALPDDQFRDALARLDGMSADVTANEQLMQLLMPTLRADFALWENYEYQPEPPLDSAITALGGDADERAPVASLAAWQAHTTGPCVVRTFPGGHFYLNQAAGEIAGAVGAALLGRESAQAG